MRQAYSTLKSRSNSALSRYSLRWVLALVICTGLAGQAGAAPFAEPGDLVLRHDLQILADEGLFEAPLTTWPLSWGDIAHNLPSERTPNSNSSAANSALTRVRRRLQEATQIGRFQGTLTASGAIEPLRVRSFAATPREEAEAGASLSWTGMRFSFRLAAQVASNSSDRKRGRLDGSYVGAALGNWMLSAGLQERWWGPGHDGSLILSNNARPVPAISFRRNNSLKFKSKWLSWIGPWTASVFAGKLESDRFVPDVKLLGARVNFKPLRSLEIGLSRTAQWGGEGRPETLSSLANLLLGRDNRGDDVTLEEEPGNQLAGIDFRWSSPFGVGPIALYGQFIGEDEAGGLPSRFIGQLGIETWGYSPALTGSYRLTLEAADTAANFYDNQPIFNYAYEHFIYKSGYRYRGRALGHPLDNDSRMISAGAQLVRDAGNAWILSARWADLNRDDGLNGPHQIVAGATDYYSAMLTHERPLKFGKLSVSIGVESLRPKNEDSSGGNKTDGQLFLQWASR